MRTSCFFNDIRYVERLRQLINESIRVREKVTLCNQCMKGKVDDQLSVSRGPKRSPLRFMQDNSCLSS